jgi:hypothetical protein
MEDLRNLMACIDEISSQIPDGMYLKMADQMKRVHDHMNGNKSIHDDTFYYSDDDSELDSDDDSDSDFAPNLDRTRLSDIALIRDQLYGSCEEDARGVQGSHEVGKGSEAYGLDSQSSV